MSAEIAVIGVVWKSLRSDSVIEMIAVRPRPATDRDSMKHHDRALNFHAWLLYRVTSAIAALVGIAIAEISSWKTEIIAITLTAWRLDSCCGIVAKMLQAVT